MTKLPSKAALPAISLLVILLPIVQIIPTARAATAAAPAPKAQGITVSPALQQIAVAQDEDKHQIDFKITNNKPSAQALQISTADFNALEDTGGLIFVGAKPTQTQKKYSLAHWISLPQPAVTVPAGQTVEVTAQILNLPTLAPGGHYGAIMLRLANGANPTSSNVIGLNPIASILLFVNKVGGDTHRLKLSSVSVRHSPLTLPSSVDLRFYNDGNTHLIPRGVVTITDPSGKLVKKGVINQDSNLILPQNYRIFPVQLNKIATSAKPGKYHLVVAFRFDGYDQFRVYQTSLLIVTPISLALIVILVAAAYFLFKNPTARKQLWIKIGRLKKLIKNRQ